MKQFESKLIDFIQNHHIKATHFVFEDSCHTVEEAALAANTSSDDIIKNVCMIDNNNNLIVAILKGKDKASSTRISKVLNISRPRFATPEEVLEKAGFPVGGIPSFGYEAYFLIDQAVMELDMVYTGGGSPNSLVKISTNELQQMNKGTIVKIRK